MEKFFNIAGPCNPAEHYMLPATERLPEVVRLVVEGWMPIFDPDPAKPWEEKLFNREVELDGKTLHIVGL